MKSNPSCDRCPKNSWRTPWSRTFRTRSTSLLALIASFITISAAAIDLSEVPTRDRKILKRWSISGSPRGLAIGSDGTIYVGLSEPQSVAAIEPSTGRILHEVVLDDPDIASTKELVTMRVTAGGKRLVVAHGSDESVSILSLPGLGVLREITLEGEVIRDVVPDPKGRYLYVLGRQVHVFDFDGVNRLRSFGSLEPMAIATNGSGSLLAIVGTERFDHVDATMVALHDTTTLNEIAREPLQTDRKIVSVAFAASDRALVVASTDWLAEKSLDARTVQGGPTPSDLRLKIRFGDLMNSQKICLPMGSGPQILASGATSSEVLFAEKRCSASASFDASPRRVTFTSLYGIDAYALAFDPVSGSVFATDRKGFITQYRVPK